MKAFLAATLVVLSMTGAAPVQADPVLRLDNLLDDLTRIERQLKKGDRGLDLRFNNNRRNLRQFRVDRRDHFDDGFDWRDYRDDRRYGRDLRNSQQRKWLERDDDD